MLRISNGCLREKARTSRRNVCYSKSRTDGSLVLMRDGELTYGLCGERTDLGGGDEDWVGVCLVTVQDLSGFGWVIGVFLMYELNIISVCSSSAET